MLSFISIFYKDYFTNSYAVFCINNKDIFMLFLNIDGIFNL